MLCNVRCLFVWGTSLRFHSLGLPRRFATVQRFQVHFAAVVVGVAVVWLVYLALVSWLSNQAHNRKTQAHAQPHTHEQRKREIERERAGVAGVEAGTEAGAGTGTGAGSTLAMAIAHVLVATQIFSICVAYFSAASVHVPPLIAAPAANLIYSL